MKIPFLGKGNSESKFEPTPEEKVLIENCTKPGVLHLEVHGMIEEAGLSPGRRGSVEEIIRSKIMENVLKGGKERPGCLT